MMLKSLFLQYKTHRGPHRGQPRKEESKSGATRAPTVFAIQKSSRPLWRRASRSLDGSLDVAQVIVFTIQNSSRPSSRPASKGRKKSGARRAPAVLLQYKNHRGPCRGEPRGASNKLCEVGNWGPFWEREQKRHPHNNIIIILII